MFGLRPSAFAATLLCVSQGMMAPPSLAQGASDTERLLKVIEEQQRRLDAQEAQLAEQKKALQALRQEVAAIQRRNDTAEAPSVARSLPMTAPSAPGVKSSATAAAAPASSGFEGLDKAVSAAREEWPGSFGAPGTDTRFKISGFYNDAEQLTYEAITELVDYLPGVGIRRDSNGLRPTVRRLDYPDAGCAGTIYARYTDPVTLAPKASPDFSPLDAWTYQTSEQDLTNAVTVSFAKRVKTGRYRRRLTVTWPRS